MNEIFKIEELRQKPIAMMTGGELEYVILHTNNQLLSAMPTQKTEQHLYYGINGLASLFGCSVSTANRIKASGVIKEAITQVGRKIVIDGDKALALINAAGGVDKVIKKGGAYGG